jgi:phosphoribosylformylglycinamidine (FGAM) synthase-like amidotransferase family enzyme
VKPRVLQLFASGINCDRELRWAFESAGAAVREVHVRELAQKPQLVRECDLVAIPGGFSYGDDLGAGKVLALELHRRLGDTLRAHHERGGGMVGICNGFQALLKAGLLPGPEGLPPLSLTWNASHHFECRWSRMVVEEPMAHVLPAGTILPGVSAHAEGRIVLPRDDEDARALVAAGVVALRYCDESGRVRGDFPHCPSGSAGAIAGLVSPSGRILGLMPHPERCLSRLHLPDRGAGAWGDGREVGAFFRGLLAPYAAGVRA